MDAFEKIVRPIVEGQIRGFLHEHPPIVEAVDWYKPRADKATTLVNSLSKRITRDLCSQETRLRMVDGLCSSFAVALASAVNSEVAGTLTGPSLVSERGIDPAASWETLESSAGVSEARWSLPQIEWGKSA